jgi:hypothetical protein
VFKGFETAEFTFYKFITVKPHDTEKVPAFIGVSQFIDKQDAMSRV